MDQDMKEGVATTDEVRIQTTRVLVAAVRFADLVSKGEIPIKSKLVCAEVGIERDGEISNKTITLLAVSPDEKAVTPLEPDRLETQREKIEKEGYNLRILGIQEVEMDDDRLYMRDFTLDLFPTEDGRLVEFRAGKKGGPPPVTVATVTTNGIIINNWQAFRDGVDLGAFRIQVNSMLDIKDVINSKPFQVYLTRLAKGEFPIGTAFIFNCTDEDNSEVNPTMAGIAALPDGTKQDLQESLKPLLQKLRETGVRLVQLKLEFTEIAECVECGEPFTPKRKDQIYCSKKCRDRVAAREYRERRRQDEG